MSINRMHRSRRSGPIYMEHQTRRPGDAWRYPPGKSEMFPRHIATRCTSARITSDMLEESLTGPPLLSPTAVQFSSDSRLLYVHDRENVHEWTIPDLRDHERHNLEESEQGICRFLNDEERIMLIGSDEESEEGIHHVAVRDLASHDLKTVADIRLKTYGLFTVLFNASDDQLLLQDYGQTGYFFRLPSMEQIRAIELKHMRGAVYSPDETELWTTGVAKQEKRNHLIAYDVETGEVLRQQQSETSQSLNRLWLAPDNKELVLVGEKSLIVLDSQSWELLRVVEIPARCEMTQPVLAYSPTSDLLAVSSDSNIGIYFIDRATWKIVHVLTVDEKNWSVRCLALSPDGRFLAAASWDNYNEVRLWDVSQRPKGG